MPSFRDKPLSSEQLEKLVKVRFPSGWSAELVDGGVRITLRAPGQAVGTPIPNNLGQVEAVLASVQRISKFESQASGKK